MKLRMAAAVPPGTENRDRLYVFLQVSAALPLPSMTRPVPVGLCISRHASVARLVDAAAAAAGLRGECASLRLAVVRPVAVVPETSTFGDTTKGTANGSSLALLPLDARLSDSVALSAVGGALIDGDTVILCRKS